MQTFTPHQIKVARATFKSLAIGDKFHIGKSFGIGANRHILSWEVIEKTSKSEGRVVELKGQRGNCLGHTRTFSAMSAVFTNY